MIEQLRHLLDTAFTNRRIRFGVVASTAKFVYLTTSFDMFDTSLVMIETLSAERSITAPAELRLYEKAWAALEQQAQYGRHARAIITTALNHRLAARRPNRP